MGMPIADDDAAEPLSVAAPDPIQRWIDDELLFRRRRGRRRWLESLAALAGALAVAGSCWAAGWQSAAIVVLGIIGLFVGAGLGLLLLRQCLSAGHPVVAVARAVVEEAVGTRMSILLIMLVLIGLPSLPLILDSTERLSYRMQFFLNWSLSGAFVLLAIVTIALCCGTVCGDISSYRIHLTLSKPLRRWEYLVGKWVGVVLLNLLLVGLIGLGTYATAQALRRQPAADSADYRAVEEQVLTARRAIHPEHPRREEYERLVTNEMKRVRDEDPALFDLDAEGGRRRIRTRMLYAWHTVSPDVVSSYLFTGLQKVKETTPVMQLRLEPFADNSKVSEAEVKFSMWLNERPFPVKQGNHEEYVLAVSQIHTLEIPTVAISDEGSLLVTIANRNLVMPGQAQPTVIGFTPGKGLELLYRVGSFEGNVIRSVIVIWAKLAVLAAFAIAAGAWLGLPTAMLAAMMIFGAALANAFIADAIDIYTGVDDVRPTFVSMVRLRAGILWEFVNDLQWWSAAKTIGAYLGDGFLLLIPVFGNYDSITEVATGRLVSLGETASAVGVLAVAYPAVLLALGWVFLERRDLMSSSL